MFIPHQVFVPALTLVVLAVWAIPPAATAVTAVTVFLLLSLHYGSSHYLAHIQWCPPTGHYRRRVREHRLHHFRNHHLWWGVSMGAADRWLGTATEIHAAETAQGPLQGGASRA